MEKKAYDKLPLGAVKPGGWLKAQLLAQKSGLTGVLEEIWEDVGPNSGWLGGSGESWERGPYYCDGMVPLAWLLEDKELLAKADKWVSWAINSQRPDGFFGPADNDDWWPRMVMLKALIQYYEAEGTRYDVPTFLAGYFDYQLAHLGARPLRDWGMFRAAENIEAVLWLYDRNGNPQLLELAALLFRQGYNWTDFFARLPYKTSIADYMNWQEVQDAKLPVDQRTVIYPDYMKSHIVNVAMGVKYPALKYRLWGDADELGKLKQGLDKLFRYHGVANGIFTGDEHLSGNSPSQGSELCAVVEFMYSLERAAEITGDRSYLDRLERAAFNALPATIDKQFRTHQYLQQANQISCTIAPRAWYNNLDDSNIFGLQPNFGCCTANMHQGWPKLVQNLWMSTPDGLAATVYAPCSVTARLANGHVLTLHEKTCYPFKNTIAICCECAEPESFELRLRLPGWCDGWQLDCNGQTVPSRLCDGFIVVNRRWNSGDSLVLTLDDAVRTSHWANNALAVESGALVYALDLGGEKRAVEERPSRFGDWEITSSSRWNYLLLPGKMVKRAQEIAKTEVNLYDTPQQLDVIEVEAQVLPQWTTHCNSAAPPPPSPVAGKPGEKQTLRLLPYGATTLRITQFPWRS